MNKLTNPSDIDAWTDESFTQANFSDIQEESKTTDDLLSTVSVILNDPVKKTMIDSMIDALPIEQIAALPFVALPIETLQAYKEYLSIVKE